MFRYQSAAGIILAFICIGITLITGYMFINAWIIVYGWKSLIGWATASMLASGAFVYLQLRS